MVAAVVAAILVVAGVGMWVWHEQPSFCGAICHTPMDNYLTTYESDLNSPATDKWGNEVADPHTMLAAYHGKLGNDCMDCHVPTLSEQIGEGSSLGRRQLQLPARRAYRQRADEGIGPRRRRAVPERGLPQPHPRRSV